MSAVTLIKVVRVEKRAEDAWFDLSLRQLRKGEVSFYRVKDALTGEWLFKVCRDSELKKVMVKAVKCPAGTRFAQLEGNSMVFQESMIEGMLYDVISIAHADEHDHVNRTVASTLEEVPQEIKANYLVKTYLEATGKQAPGKNLVTLCASGDEKAMVTLFLLERAWPMTERTSETVLTQSSSETAETMKNKCLDTGQSFTCPICNATYHLMHVEKGTALRHTLRHVRKSKSTLTA